MQTFQDTETGQFWQFEDDVLVTGTNGSRYFNAPHGAALDVPLTLVPAELPPPVEPEPYVPQFVSRFQGREAMWRTPHGNTTLFEAAEAVLADPETPAMYRRAWDDLQEFRRDSEMLAAIAGMLGLTAAQIDALFILAASIKA
ncbi:hypothetical protein ABE485_13650 [Achromobacter spanius]|uniref:hypothetical protein n=1 Tax=Achromobacter spanius TaxID=217203 RepID=UPI003209A44A